MSTRDEEFRVKRVELHRGDLCDRRVADARDHVMLDVRAVTAERSRPHRSTRGDEPLAQIRGHRLTNGLYVLPGVHLAENLGERRFGFLLRNETAVPPLATSPAVDRLVGDLDDKGPLVAALSHMPAHLYLPFGCARDRVCRAPRARYRPNSSVS